MSKKRELGLGIRALLNNIDQEVNENPEKVVKELTRQVVMVSPGTVEVNPFQPRKDFDGEALRELSDSIRIHGLIQPITVRRMSEGHYQLITGERRLRASSLAGLPEIPAYIRIANDQEMLEMALIENIQREDLNAIEIANTYQRLLEECNLTHENLSGRVGKKRSTVTNYLRLLKLPPDIQAAVKSDRLTMGHARALASVDNLALQLTLFKKCLAEGLSVRGVEELIASYSKTKTKENPPKTTISGEVRRVQDAFSAFFGTKVVLKRENSGKGQIVIKFNSDAELHRIFDNIEKDF